MTAEARLLVVHNYPSTFVKQDIELLRSGFAVRELYITRPHHPDPATIARLVAGSDLIYCWFASWHAVIPVLVARLLGRPSIIAVGGYDTANMPEIQYGHQRPGLPRVVSRFVMRSANRLITHSYFSRAEAVTNAGIPANRIEVVYLGLANGTSTGLIVNREARVLTVGNVNRSNLTRKGLQLFAESSRVLSDVDFTVVGRLIDDAGPLLMQAAGPKMRLLGFLPDKELHRMLHTTSVYAQLSAHESFGLSVLEAMLAGCIPVVTRAGSLPEVVGDVGEYADDPRPDAVASVIQRALASGPVARARARDRVIALFPVEARGAGLLSLVRATLTSSRVPHSRTGGG